MLGRLLVGLPIEDGLPFAGQARATASVVWTSATWTWGSRSALRLTRGRAARIRSASAKWSPAVLGGCGVRDIGPGVLPVKARSLSSLLAAGPLMVTSSQRLPEPKAARLAAAQVRDAGLARPKRLDEFFFARHATCAWVDLRPLREGT